MPHLNNKVAIITGGASGIGKGCTEAFIAAGAKVIIADIDDASAQQLAKEMGASAIAVHCDVCEAGAFEQLREAALNHFGQIDIVMNNAGTLTSGKPEEIPLSEWQRVFDINFMSTVRSNEVFVPHFIEQGHGHLVNTASFSGLYSYAYDRLPYAASKAALIQLSEGLALYLKPLGIGVTCLCPGPVKTNIMSSLKTVFSEGLDIRGPGEQFELMEAREVGDLVAEAISSNTFMLQTHPKVAQLLIERATHWDDFLQHYIDSPHIIAPGKKAPAP